MEVDITMNEYWDTIIKEVMPYVVSAAIAALIYAKFWLDNHRVKQKVESIEEQIKNSEDEYYVICPTCGNKLDLAKLKFYIKRKAAEDEQNDNN